jgi:hypothetical protein
VEAERLIERPGWGVEVVASRSDFHHLDVLLTHRTHRVLTKGAAHALATRRLANRDSFDLTVPSLRIDYPADIASDLPDICLGHDDVFVGTRVVEFRDRLTVVVGPMTVLVYEHIGRNHRAEALLVERTEHLDGEVDQCRQV